MINEKHSVDLTPQDLDVIEAALRTQEKILSVQSRAGGDGTARARLNELQRVLGTLRRQSSPTPQIHCQGWGSMARGLFG